VQKNNNNFRALIAKFSRGLFMVLCMAALPCYAWHPPLAYAFAAPENGLGGLTGKITGDLKAVSKVTIVLLRDEEIVDKTKTDEEGFYKFRYIEEGRYELKATKEGYRTCIVTKIPVAADKVTKLDFYQPKINNHQPEGPVVETFHYYFKGMKNTNISMPR
jgi:hypothetical protein